MAAIRLNEIENWLGRIGAIWRDGDAKAAIEFLRMMPSIMNLLFMIPRLEVRRFTDIGAKVQRNLRGMCVFCMRPPNNSLERTGDSAA